MHEMVDILQAMFDEGMGIYSKAHMLWEVLQECDIEMDADANVFVRYCGTSRQRSAYGRHAHDLVSPTPDIKSLFMRVCHDLYPEVVEAAQIDELPDGEVEFQLMHSQDWVRDLREQSMIALFGQETLLNTARGGVGRQAAHHQLDNDQFSALGTTLLTNLALYNQPFLNVDAVNAYARQVQQYANANSATTGTRRYPITDSVRDMLAEMAIPVLVNKYPVMVTIGADLPLEMQQEVKPWYKGGFDSADLSIEILNNLGGCELGYLTSATSYVRTMYDNKQLPFVDLFPWTKKDDQDFDAALGLLRHYLQATKPIIVLTFSQKVSSAALGNFQQAWGAKVHQMIQLLGTLTLSKYDEIPEDNFDDTCCIVIPCIHPGYVQYSTVRQDVTVRLISKAMAVVWLAMDEAIKWSKKGDLTKRQICEKVMQSVDRKVNSGTDFGKTLAELKNELADINLKAAQRKPKQVVDPKQKVATKISAQQEKSPAEIIQKTAAQVEREVHDESEAGRGSRLTVHGATLVIQSSSVRYRRALQQLYMVTDCGLSLGKPQSAERIAQSRKLIGLSLAHLKTQSVGSSDDDLRKWLTKVPAQRLYYFEANSISEQASDIPDLLAVFLDKEVNPDIDNWEGDTEEARQASSELVAWVVSEFVPGSVKAATSFEDNIKDLARNFHALMKKQDTKLANVLTRARKEAADVALLFEGDGSEVTVRPSGSGDKQTALLALKWLGADGDEYELEDFQLPWSCMPIAPGEPRYLYLTQHGLDVQDKNGRSLGTSKVRPVTLPIHNLVNALVQNPLQEELLRLWELHSGLTVDEALFQDPNVVSAPAADSFRSLPASFYNGRSLPFETDKDASRKLAKDKNISEMKKSLPFQPGNAAWLINKFITTKYPEGGEVDLASPASFPDAHSMWTALAA